MSNVSVSALRFSSGTSIITEGFKIVFLTFSVHFCLDFYTSFRPGVNNNVRIGVDND